MAAGTSASEPAKKYWLWPAGSLLLQVVFAVVIYNIVDVSENGRYEFPLLASRQNVVTLLGTLAGLSLLTGITSTYVVLRYQKSHYKWLWLLLCCLPCLFMGCLYLHFLLMIEALV